jgi:hypothetical protein
MQYIITAYIPGDEQELVDFVRVTITPEHAAAMLSKMDNVAKQDKQVLCQNYANRETDVDVYEYDHSITALFGSNDIKAIQTDCLKHLQPHRSEDNRLIVYRDSIQYTGHLKYYEYEWRSAEIYRSFFEEIVLTQKGELPCQPTSGATTSTGFANSSS